jgi:hypothetical protein
MFRYAEGTGTGGREREHEQNHAPAEVGVRVRTLSTVLLKPRLSTLDDDAWDDLLSLLPQPYTLNDFLCWFLSSRGRREDPSDMTMTRSVV